MANLKRRSKPFLVTLAFLLLGWLVLTLWVEQEGSRRSMELGSSENGKAAYVIYDPDPIHNLDQQVCEAFAQALADRGWRVNVSTVAAAQQSKDSIDLYVFGANTYNWSPDWAICNFIKTKVSLEQKKVVAITFGAGSTEGSQKEFESLIRSEKAILIDSRSFWLWRPNDDPLLQESNVILAVNLARNWADEIATRIATENKPI
jgi:hypothetical protein